MEKLVVEPKPTEKFYLMKALYKVGETKKGNPLTLRLKTSAETNSHTAHKSNLRRFKVKEEINENEEERKPGRRETPSPRASARAPDT